MKHQNPLILHSVFVRQLNKSIASASVLLQWRRVEGYLTVTDNQAEWGLTAGSSVQLSVSHQFIDRRLLLIGQSLLPQTDSVA